MWAGSDKASDAFIMMYDITSLYSLDTLEIILLYD
jgi:hypothetical protein